MEHEPEEQLAVLQERVRERLTELGPIEPTGDDYVVAADAVIEAALTLVDYEEKLPHLLDRRPRHLSLQIVRWSGVVAGALGASLVIAAVAGWTPRWSVLIAVVPGIAAVALLRTPVPPPRADHLALRPGAVTVAAGSLVIATGSVARLSIWFALAGALVVLTGLWHLRRGTAARPA